MKSSQSCKPQEYGCMRVNLARSAKWYTALYAQVKGSIYMGQRPFGHDGLMISAIGLGACTDTTRPYEDEV